MYGVIGNVKSLLQADLSLPHLYFNKVFVYSLISDISLPCGTNPRVGLAPGSRLNICIAGRFLVSHQTCA